MLRQHYSRTSCRHRRPGVLQSGLGWGPCCLLRRHPCPDGPRGRPHPSCRRVRGEDRASRDRQRYLRPHHTAHRTEDP